MEDSILIKELTKNMMLRDTTRVRLKRLAKENGLICELAPDKCVFGTKDNIKECNENFRISACSIDADDTHMHTVKSYIFPLTTCGSKNIQLEDLSDTISARVVIVPNCLDMSVVVIEPVWDSKENIVEYELSTAFELLDIDDTLFDYDIDEDDIIYLANTLSIPDFVWLYLNANLNKDKV